ncbi:MAG: acyl carrier protein [Bdellovibrionales bacterium]|nr:acyl carrier protein [Bdellovibrionales bacterium]
MSQDVLAKLIDVASQHFKVDRTTLTPETDFFKELGINSFQALSLLSEIEKKFSIEIPDYELQGVNTFNQLAEVISSRIG